MALTFRKEKVRGVMSCEYYYYCAPPQYYDIEIL